MYLADGETLSKTVKTKQNIEYEKESTESFTHGDA
jgi:hypothetical protein